MAPLRCAAKFDPFLSLDCARVEGVGLPSANRPREMSILVEHVRTLYREGGQDGLIVVEGQNTQQLLAHIASLEPLIFSSNSPTFVPMLYSDMVRLRFDTNVLFYEGELGFGRRRTKITDRFAIKGGPPIAQDLATWDRSTGLQLKAWLPDCCSHISRLFAFGP